MSQIAHPAIHTAIESANQEMMDLFRQRDAAGIADLYTPSAQVLPPNTEALSGPVAIQAFWQSLMDMGIQELVLETGETEQCGETTVEVSQFELKAGGQVLDYGKYIVIWKHIAGEWKLHRDIFNSSKPAAT